MKNKLIIYTFIFLTNLFHLKAQSFEFKFGIAIDFPVKKQMEGMRQIENLSLELSCFPIKRIPIGLVINSTIGRYSIYREGKEETDQIMELKNNFFRHSIGFIVSSQSSKRLVKPYFSAMIGQGMLNTKFNLFINPNCDNDNCLPKDEKLYKFRNGLYKFEAGIEMNLAPQRKNCIDGCFMSGVSIFISCGFVGSFKKFEYHNVSNFGKSTSPGTENLTNNYNTLREEFLNGNASLYKEKLVLWQFSAGFVLRLVNEKKKNDLPKESIF